VTASRDRTSQRHAGGPQWRRHSLLLGQAPVSTRDTIRPATISGTLNPATGAVALSNAATCDLWNSCYTRDTSNGTNSAGGATYAGNITLNGTIWLLNPDIEIPPRLLYIESG
jgi:hypothetical protein